MANFPRSLLSCSLALIASALVLIACGGSADDEARNVQTTSVIAKNDPVREFMVREDEIEKAPGGGVERAFLQYWSDLQFQAWAVAARTYEPGLRRFIGDDVLIRALSNQGPSYLSTRPDIVSAKVTGDRAVIRYFRIGDQATAPTSLSWIRNNTGRWLITYDALLDQALAQSRQLETQQSIDPISQKPIPAAVRAGNSARKLQSQYVAQRERAAGLGQ